MNFRNILVWGMGVPVTLVLFVAVLLSMLLSRSGNLVHSIGAFWMRIIMALGGVRVRAEGLERLPGEGPFIILSNHQGAFDIPVLQACLPVQFRWVAKRSLFSIPVVGWSMSMAGYIPVDRDSPQKAFKSMEDAAKKIKAGTSVVVFPEGTRSDTGRLLPFKKGAFTLAVKSGVPIVPVAVSGTKDIMKRGKLSIRPAEVRLAVGVPFSVQGMSEKALRDRAKEAIGALLDEIS